MGFSSPTLNANITVTGAPGAHTADGIQYVSTLGADSNDGLSYGAAKASLASAVAALPAGGGVIEVGAGVFTIPSPVVIPSSVHVRGAGRGVTVIQAPDNFAAVGVVGAPSGAGMGSVLVPAPNASFVSITDLTIDGRKSAAGNANAGQDGNQCGIYCTSNFGLHLARLEVKNCPREGIYTSTTGWSLAEDIYTVTNGRAGYEVDAMSYTDLVDVKANGNGTYGIDIVGGAVLTDNFVTVLGGTAYGNNIGCAVRFARGTAVIGLKSRANTAHGILVQGSSACGVSACYSFGNTTHGIYVLDSVGCTITGNRVRNNNSDGAHAGVGIYLFESLGAGSCVDNEVTGNTCFDDQGGAATQFRGIAEGQTNAGGADYNTFANNNVRLGNLNPPVFVGAHTKVKGNQGLSGVRTVAAAVTATVADEVILANAGGGAFAVTLPAVAAGARVVVKKTDATANAVTITPGSGTIDGAASVALTIQWQSMELVSDGTNWFGV